MHQLQLPFSTFDLTPPSSPTRFLDTMPWLKRTPQTPTSMPLPLSPTQSLNASENDILSLPSPNPSSPLVPKHLHTKSTTFPLPTKPNPSSLASTRDAARWLFCAPPARAMTAPVKNELGDHFTRALPSYQETQARLRRRKEASQRRVEGMRGWLASTSTAVEKEKETRCECRGAQTGGRMHQRFDSGSHEYGEGGMFEDNDTSGAASDAKPSLPGLHEDVLWFSLFRLRKRGLGGSECVGCGEAHADALSDEGAVVWLLHGCGHVVDDRCLDKLRECGAGCHACMLLGVQLGKFGAEEWRVRRGRLANVTGGGV